MDDACKPEALPVCSGLSYAPPLRSVKLSACFLCLFVLVLEAALPRELEPRRPSLQEFHRGWA